MVTHLNDLAQYCCELLSSVGPCVARRMFGGYGISVEGLTLAIVTDLGNGEKLWLKASPDTRAKFEMAGRERFTYVAKGSEKSLDYYSAPDEAMESAGEMAPWARLAWHAALDAQQRRLNKKPSPLSRGKQPPRA